MLSKECRLARREIDELELGQRPSDGATAHLSACAGCTQFRAERNELRQLVGSLETVTAPADFEMRLRARIAREESSRDEPLFARLVRVPALAAAALFIAVGATVVWVAQRNDQPTTPVAAVQPSSQSSTVVANGQSNETTSPGESTGTDETSKPGPEQLAVSVAGSRNRPRGRTEDHSLIAADPIPQNDQAFVNAPSRPVVFALEDDRGTKRKIAVPPVSFGAQNVVDNRVPVSYSPNSRVW